MSRPSDPADVSTSQSSPGLKLPIPDYPEEKLFESIESLYRTARSSISRFLKGLRRMSARTSRGNRRRASVASFTTGRNTRTVGYVQGINRLAPLPSIRNAIASGHYFPVERRFGIRSSDLVGWHRIENENLTLILLVDVSNSTFPFIRVFKEILQSLADNFRRHQDRVGLISLQGLQAKILLHPTHNYRVVARGLTRLKIHGETPLADGLSKSLHMARAERTKCPGSRSVVILLSDCFPEPLAPGVDTAFDDPAYRESLNVASGYRRQRIALLIINPTFVGDKARHPGEILSQKLAERSGGRLVRLYRHPDDSKRPPSRKELDQILGGVERYFIEHR